MRPATAPPRVYGYARVSTEEQRESGLGIEVQLAAIATTAARLGFGDAEVVRDEGLSGALPLEKRPQLSALLERLRPGDVLLVAKLDRLSREDYTRARIEHLVKRKRARIVSAAGEGTADDTAESIFMRRIFAAVAEYERNLIRTRTRNAARRKQERGESAGGTPFGFRAVAVSGRRTSRDRQAYDLVPCPSEQSVVDRMRELHASGLSLRAVGRRLEQEGMPTRAGGRWHPDTIRKILSPRACPATTRRVADASHPSRSPKT